MRRNNVYFTNMYLMSLKQSYIEFWRDQKKIHHTLNQKIH